MTTFLLGLVIFIGTHCISIFNEAWRNSIVQRFGEISWKITYSVFSFVGLFLLIWGYPTAQAASPFLFSPPSGFQYLAILLLVPVFPLLFAAYIPGNIKRKTKHPMLLATKIWAFAHLLISGSLVNLILFGSFLTWAIVDRVSMKKRDPRPLPGAPPAKYNDLISILLGLGVYLLFLSFLHELLIGVPTL